MTDAGYESDPRFALTAPSLSEANLTELARFGVEERVAAGQVLYRAGDESYDFFVILEGSVEIVRPDGDRESRIRSFDGPSFLGELSLITGQRPAYTARVTSAGRVLHIERAAFRRLMGSQPDLADLIFGALAARRDLLREGDGAGALVIVGSRYSPDALALRAFAARSHLPHRWIDVEDAADPEAMLAEHDLRPGELPAALTATETLRNTTPPILADHLGLTFHSVPGYLFDLVVVGTGPAGLAASVYGASEGLDTVSVDAVVIGGQAGASSRIENYVGFPTGISGEDLASRAAMQAQRLGAKLNAPCEAASLRAEHGYHAVALADGSEIATRAVIVASGARYRRLAVDDLNRFEGAGVYYAATDLEVRTCGGQEVIVVGGGNSAGQAAIYLAQQGSRVCIVIRRRALAETMSRYLIERIEANPHITVRSNTQVRALLGVTHLEQATVEHTPTGTSHTVPCAGLFCFIGADPSTEWLGGALLLDDDGFVLTDRSLPASALADFTGRDPLPFETSLPGVFAVGDVRHGSVKRVAAAVGEGSSAVRAVHEYLAATSGRASGG